MIDIIDMIDSIHKLPIVIVATARSGSTSLGLALARHYKVQWLNEPYHFPDTAHQLSAHHVNKIPYVTKFLIHQLPALEIHQTILNSDCFKIKLLRNNLVDQIVSLYIGEQTNNWSQQELSIPDYTVALDSQSMFRTVFNVCYNNKKLENLKINFDLELSYENLNFKETSEKIKFKTSPPTNINDIIELATEQLNKFDIKI